MSDFGSPTPPWPQHPAPPLQPGYGASAPHGAFAAPYTAPAPGSFPTAPPERASGALGLVALLLALAALVIPSVVAGVAGFQVGAGVGRQVPSSYVASDFDLGLLSPVRDTVLVGEIAFWGGTVLGVWAIVQGIVAIARRRGNGTGIAAIVVAVVAAVAFAVVAMIAVTTGVAVGAASAF